MQDETHTGGGEERKRSNNDKRLKLGEIGATLGFGHSDNEARAIETDDAEALLQYLEESSESLIHYINSLSEDELDHVIDSDWDPPVTRGVRLVSIIDDAAQHMGQAAYAVGALRYKRTRPTNRPTLAVCELLSRTRLFTQRIHVGCSVRE